MRDKAYQLKPLLTDRNALSQCDTEIRECQKYIDYFNEELSRMEKSRPSSMANLTVSTDSLSAGDRNSAASPASAEIPPRSSSIENRDIKKYSTLGKAKKA
jgi:hypothetical protein